MSISPGIRNCNGICRFGSNCIGPRFRGASSAASWLMCSGFCAVAFALGDGWKWGPICFGLAVLTTIQIYAGWKSRPNLPPLDSVRVSADGVILQTSPYTCVPASGAGIAASSITTERARWPACATPPSRRHLPRPGPRRHGKLGLPGRKVTAINGIQAVRPPRDAFRRRRRTPDGLCRNVRGGECGTELRQNVPARVAPEFDLERPRAGIQPQQGVSGYLPTRRFTLSRATCVASRRFHPWSVQTTNKSSSSAGTDMLSGWPTVRTSPLVRWMSKGRKGVRSASFDVIKFH